MKKILFPILCASLLFIILFSCGNNTRTWNISEYGAIGDGTTLNTEFIQKAIDECSAAGGGIVLIEKGIYVTGTILLKDNVTLKVTENAQLIGSDNPLDYQSIDPFTDATGQLRGKCLIGALNATNIGIIGKGTIDGRGKSFLHKNLLLKLESLGKEKSEIASFASNRPFLIRFVKSTEIKVKEIHLRQPAAWTCHFYQCSNILVDGISIYSHAHSNNDGIDLDSSHDAIIKDCTIDSGDDAICFKTTSPEPCHHIHVSGCRLKSHWGTIKFGTESMGDFHDIRVENCTIHKTRGGGIKILSVDGANINNISIDNIQMDSVDMPIFIRLGERLRTYRNAPKQEVGSINNISIQNIKATTWNLKESRVSPPSGIFLTGTPNHKLGTIQLKHIEINLPGGGTSEQSMAQIEEQEEKYPEFSFFGVLPASGVYGRHIENLSIEILSVKIESEDLRKPFLLEDVDKKTMSQIVLNNIELE